jgi:hypothetical protein
MAAGQRQTFIASPQPGTTNLPYGITVPGGKGGAATYIPPFVPVNISVTDTLSAAITAQTSALTLVLGAEVASIITQIGTAGVPVPGTMLACLAEINDNLTRIADNKQSISKGISDLNIAIGTLTAAKNENTQILTTKLTNQITSNNFLKAVSGEKPVMPTLTDQIKISVTEGLSLLNATTSINFVNGVITKSVAVVSSIITGSSVYQTASGFLSKAKDSILSILPPSVQSALSKAKTGKII